jgi:hypothetical protein
LTSDGSIRGFILFALLSATASAADTPAVLNFDNYPDGTALTTTQYPGLTFSNAIVLTAGISLNEFEFPPHSGSGVASDNGGPINIRFATPVFSFGAYFTYTKKLTLTASDAQGNPLATATSGFSNNLACLGGPPCSGQAGSGANEFLQVTSKTGIASVTIGGDSAGGSFVLDDAIYSSVADTIPPFGSFDTPINKVGNVVGAIGVTGWALDNVGATKVEIYRDPVGNEAKGNFGLIYIGNAVFVAGARPDVQGLYPTYPNANRAGWGYQLLTNFLPGSGNGTFTLHAFAYDAAGNVTEIGTPGKTITCTNASATKPFGTIDTPGQGETVSGADYVNFGWALTPPPGGSFVIPTNGSTMTVIIDGAPVGQPTYNQLRSDIASLFPGYTNSSGAVGFFHLNTSQFANGVHAISWNVFDNAGRGEGLGSRYFTIANSGQANAPHDRSTTGSVPDGHIRKVRGESSAPLVKQADLKISLRRNSLTAPLETLTQQKDRSYALTVEQLERFELHLGAVRDGFVLVAKKRQPLPAGSTLDPETGIFYWQTAAPFLGNFDLVFIPDSHEAAAVQVRIRIIPQEFK